MKNKIVATFLLTLLVVVGLEAMYFLPKLSLGGKPLRRVDLLSDVRPDKVEPAPLVADSDTLVLPPPVRPAFVDTCKTGLTCIEDYSDSTKRGGLRFFMKHCCRDSRSDVLSALLISVTLYRGRHPDL